MIYSINGILKKIKSSQFWRSVFSLVTGSVIAHSISLLTTPIVSRLYTASDYGFNALIVSSASIIIGFATLGLSSAIMVPKTNEESDKVLSVSLFTSYFAAMIIVLSLILLSYIFNFTIFNYTSIIDWMLMFLVIITTVTSSQLSIYANRLKRNRVLFTNVLIGTLATLLITIPLGLLNAGGIGLTIATIIASSFQVAQMIVRVRPKIIIPTLEMIKSVFKSYIYFVKYQYPSNFISNLAYQLPSQGLSHYFGSSSLGLFNMSDKILGIPSRLVASPIGTIYFRTVSEHHKNGMDFSKFTFKLITGLMSLAYIPLVVLIIWGEEIFGFILGNEWSYAGKISSYLIFVYIMYFCETVTSYCRVAIGRQKANFYISLARLFVTILSLSLGIFLFKSLLATIILFSISITLYLVTDMYINFHYLGNYKYKYLIFSISYALSTFILWYIFR